MKPNVLLKIARREKMKHLLMLRRGKRGKFMMQMDLASESHRLNGLFGVTGSIEAFMEIAKDLHSERLPQRP